MAILKDTYIEGNLTVEGSLLANSLAAGQKGIKFPFIDEINALTDGKDANFYKDKLVKFSGDTGGINAASLKIIQNNDDDVILSTSDNKNITKDPLNLFIDQPGYKIFVRKTDKNTQIKIDNNAENPQWFFPK